MRSRPGGNVTHRERTANGYVLYVEGLVPDSAVVDGKALTALRMPKNRDRFIGDPRPDVKERRLHDRLREAISPQGRRRRR